MTFSIVARVGDAYGVAVASKFPAVGAMVPAARVGVGAVATQSFARISYKEDGLALLAQGHDAAETVRRLTSTDEHAAERQVGVVGVDSQATFTGGSCMDWAGGVAGGDDESGYAIQGNILAGAEVVDAMERAWLTTAGAPLPRRLLAALLAGDAAGGDRRGRQGAALIAVQAGTGYDHAGVLADLRVDDHPEAPRELERLLDLHELVSGPPEDVAPLVGDLAAEVAERLTRLGHPATADDAERALEAWAGVENYEMRLAPGGIDARVLRALREATA